MSQGGSEAIHGIASKPPAVDCAFAWQLTSSYGLSRVREVNLFDKAARGEIPRGVDA